MPVLNLKHNDLKLFNGINFANPVIDIILPENTWTVNYTDTILFNVSNQTRVAALINQCCATDQVNRRTLLKKFLVFDVFTLILERFHGCKVYLHSWRSSYRKVSGILRSTDDTR